MALKLEPEAEISPLPNADGSVAFSYGGYKVIASANGPIETVKRDEYAFEAFVDVTVRPPAGVGGKTIFLLTTGWSGPRASRLIMSECTQVRGSAISSPSYSRLSVSSSL